MKSCTMMTYKLLLAVGLLAASLVSSQRIGQDEDVQTQLWSKILDTSNLDETLINQGKQFPKGVYQVADNIWIAIGFALANSILIVGDDGYIIIDTLDSYEPAREVAELFKPFTQNADGSYKRLAGIIYTHDHPDHVSGTRAFLEVGGGSDMPEIWAYETMEKDFWEKWQYLRPQLMARSLRQIGVPLPTPVRNNSGIGPFYVFGTDSAVLMYPPNRVLRGTTQDITIAGIDMTLVFIPGETKNQMGAYIKDKKVFVAADDYYHTFPNLYAIRGTPPRPIIEWMQSLDLILSFDIEILLPCHTLSLRGAGEVIEKITVYRDAIQYVIDQTMRLINKGLHPNDIALQVRLPDSIRNAGQLEENYGIVEWSVKSVFESQLGWFSGYPEELYPPSTSEAGCRTVDMIGRKDGKPSKKSTKSSKSSDSSKSCKYFKDDRSRGRCYILEEGDRVVNSADSTDMDLRYALQLVSNVINCDNADYLAKPDPTGKIAGNLRAAKRVRGEIMIRLANLQPSPNGRNYLLTYVTEENGIGPFGGYSPNANDKAPIMLLSFPMLLEKMKVMVIPEQVAGVKKSVQLNQGGACYRLLMRNSILATTACSAYDGEYDLTITLSNEATVSFRLTLAGDVDPSDLGAQEGVDLVENTLTLVEFFGWFESGNQQPMIPYGL